MFPLLVGVFRKWDWLRWRVLYLTDPKRYHR